MAFTTSHLPSSRASSSLSEKSTASIPSISSPTFITDQDLEQLLTTIPLPSFSSFPPPSDPSTPAADLDSAKSTLASLLSLLPFPAEEVKIKLNVYLSLQDPRVASCFPDLSSTSLLSFLQTVTDEEVKKVEKVNQSLEEISKMDQNFDHLMSVQEPHFIYDDDASVEISRPAAKKVFNRLMEINRKFKSLSEAYQVDDCGDSQQLSIEDQKEDQNSSKFDQSDDNEEFVSNFENFVDDLNSKLSTLEGEVDEILTSSNENSLNILSQKLDEIDSEIFSKFPDTPRHDELSEDHNDDDYIRNTRENKEIKRKLRQIDSELLKIRLPENEDDVTIKNRLKNLIEELTGSKAHERPSDWSKFSEKRSLMDQAAEILKEFELPFSFTDNEIDSMESKV
ncbi:hypothetical protein P9112_013735 [Eukaryota sp. TZLM1-RC]